MMDELKSIVIKKIGIYTDLYEVAKIMKQEDNERYYAQCVGKLNEMLKILIAS
jgi:hypothetical protein